MMPSQNHDNPTDLALADSLETSLEIEELADDDLDDIVGACGQRRSLGWRRRGGLRASQASFSKRSLSISGQTIVKPDGTSITSFSMQLEEINSQASEVIDFG
ncbi:hypothetical protein [Alkalinema sp. FACHB-956]|uniref:hypothetical protein n=1 Tax=Alkalinema sp. FACHB-956 TaxID=2692768 RepID=UPI001684FA85|nr:hypothetical protein [Alkalinema sp. FACHB-956]MBD2329099.1 hypothetical protein [Alkalinema sp. FACHB-956]